MRFRRRVLTFLIPLAVLGLLAVATVYWGAQQRALVTLAEGQRTDAVHLASTAEAHAALAEASLTAIGVAQQRVAAATASAVAVVLAPRQILESDLGKLFAAYEDPTGAPYDQLPRYFGPDALSALRNEADYLRAQEQHLGGTSTFSIESSSPSQDSPDSATVQTTERWQYDEQDDANKQVRCFVETSNQTYTLQHSGQDWLVQSVKLGTSTRSNCP